MTTLKLKKKRERSLQRRHPWVFSGALEGGDDVAPGSIVRLADQDGAFLAWGYANAASQIRVRVLDWHEQTAIDDAWWRARIKLSVGRRAHLPGGATADAIRLVSAEADGLPGLTVDRYGDGLVIQSSTAGIDAAKTVIVEALTEVTGAAWIMERSEADVRKAEGLSPVSGALVGEPPEYVDIKEGEASFRVNVSSGHKTGFYLDQRDNRRRVAKYADGRSMLDVFCYTGAFSINALMAGASQALLVDSSRPALELAEANIASNDITSDRAELVEGNAFEVSRSLRDAARSFGLIVVDPPKFAVTRSQLHKAERAYKDINLMAIKLAEPGGFVATFSCSGAVNGELLQRIIGWAAIDAKRDVRIVESLAQAPDHPIDPLFPESQYLCGFILEVD